MTAVIIVGAIAVWLACGVVGIRLLSRRSWEPKFGTTFADDEPGLAVFLTLWGPLLFPIVGLVLLIEADLPAPEWLRRLMGGSS